MYIFVMCVYMYNNIYTYIFDLKINLFLFFDKYFGDFQVHFYVVAVL